MEYDKRSYQKTNDKKVLHKIRKHWVVVSTALLMALGGGAAATHVSANADTTNANNGSNASSTNTIKERLNQQLQTPQKQQNTNRQASVNNNNNGENNNQNNNSQNESIINEAKVLHSRIVSNAGQNIANQQQTNNNTAQSDAAGQGRVAVNAPKVNNNSVNVGKINTNNITKQNATNNNGGMAKANANNNKVVLNRRIRRSLGTVADGSTMPSLNQSTSNDPDGNFTGYTFNSANQSYYLPYSDANAADGNYSDYGLITVQYIDASDNNRIIASTTDGPTEGVQPFGSSTNPTQNDVAGYAKNIPQVSLGDGDSDGYSLGDHNGQNAFDSGSQIHNYIPGENQFLTINVHRNHNTQKPGTIVVQYLDADNDNQLISSRTNSDMSGASFDDQNFIKNVPNGYSYANKYTTQNGDSQPNPENQDPITKYNDGVQTLNIYVNQVSNSASDTVIYRDSSDNNKQVATKLIYGTYKNPISSIPLNQLETYLPSGYDFDSKAQSQVTNNPTKFASKTNEQPVYIEVKKNSASNATPKDITSDEGTIIVHYKTGSLNNSSDVDTVTLQAPVNNSFDANNYIGKNVPAGYTYADNNSNQNDQSDTANGGENAPTPGAPTIVTKFTNGTQNYIVLVNKNANQPVVGKTPITDSVQYQKVDISGTPSTNPDYGKLTNYGQPFTITGAYGTPIPYSQYSDFVPSGYTFYKWSNATDKNYIANGRIYDALIENNNSLSAPITVNYFDQNGQNVNTQSDDKPLDYSDGGVVYGQTFTAKDLATNSSMKHMVPNGYSLSPDSENNQTYQVNGTPQTINLIVQGAPVNPNKNDSRYQLNIKRIVKTSNGTKLESDVVNKMPISGDNGDVITVNPNDYVPNPMSDYTEDNDSNQQVKIVPVYNQNGNSYGLKGVDGHDNLVGIDPSSKTMTATFTYTENEATAKVFYEDPSDGNNIVGSSSITGQPATKMSDFYKGHNNEPNIDSLVPYGYDFKDNASTNASDLVNGNTYVIDVTNAHLQPEAPVQPRPGYGYITIHYGHGYDANGQNGTTYSEVTTSGPTTGASSYFNIAKAQNSTRNNGWMPDIYVNPSTITHDNSVQAYQNSPQDYYINVDQASNNPKNADGTRNTNYDPSIGTLVSDAINYKVLNSDGSSDTSVGNNGIISTLMINGKDGNPIDYTPYQNNVPQGYSYDGTQQVSSIYDKGQNTSDNPVATIYVKVAHNATTNMFPDYYPSDDVNHANGNNSDHTPANQYNKNTNPNGVSDGDYFPGQQAPVDGENPHDPVPGWSNTNHKTPNSDWEHDDEGDVPTGYVPGWVSDGSGHYKSGYVPSDDIPNGYIPGLVPNGRGKYVAGYVPSKKSDWPTGKNGNDPIPNYVPGRIPNGHGGYTPGVVPNKAPYATDTAGTMMIQYVDGITNQAISDVPVGGVVGNDPNNSDDRIVLNSDSPYMKNVPIGYTSPSDMGEETQPNNISSSTPKPDYYFTDKAGVVNIRVYKQATANVVYEEDDDANHTQVGSAPLVGKEGDTVDFGQSGNEHQYEQLLPYNYTLDTNNPTASTNGSKLSNGADYVIYVKHGNLRPSTGAHPQMNIGQMTIEYVTGQNSDVVGTDTFVGKDGNVLMGTPATAIGKTNASDGYIPYGYMANSKTQSDVTAATSAQFSSTPGLYKIHVDPDSQAKQPAPSDTDDIAYDVVETKTNADGSKYNSDHMLVKGNNNKLVASDSNDAMSSASGTHVSNGKRETPIIFKVRGRDGSTINYTPYQLDVPNGYQYDGMGSHNDLIDKVHGTNNNYDMILLKPMKSATQTGNINITYITEDANGQNQHTYDTIDVSGMSGTPFNLTYYENDMPDNGEYQYAGTSGNKPTYYTNDTQNITIFAKPKNPAPLQYSNIKIHFVEAGNTSKQVPGSVDEIMTGHVGDLFNPEEYELNTPENTSFSQIVSGDDITEFDGHNDQTVNIAVNPNQGYEFNDDANKVTKID